MRKHLAGLTFLLLAVAPAAAGGPLAMRVGDVHELTLPGNPGTGYQWEYDAEGSVNPDLVSVTAAGYRPAEGGRVGAPSDFVFRIRAEAPGKASLRFRYRRPWESVPPLRQEVVEVAVSR